MSGGVLAIIASQRREGPVGYPSAVEGRCQLPISSGKTASLAKHRGAMPGGFLQRQFSWVRRVSGVCQVGGVSEQPLHLWSVYLTVLFPRALRRFPARLVWPETELVSELSALFSGAVHSLDPRPVPPDLLLLPRRILQIVLGRSSGMRRERAPQELSRRTNAFR